MIKHMNSSKFALLLMSVSSLALVSGCSGIKNPFSSDRPDQMVSGARHAPVLNAASAPAPTATSSATPFDMYNSASDIAAAQPVRPSAAPSAAPFVSPAKKESLVRKPIPGNPGAGNSPYDNEQTPALSSVPPKPVQFKDVKAGHSQQVQDLRTEYDQAQQAKSKLMREPSQQQTTPVSQPVKAEVPLPEQAVYAHPRRGIDIMTQEQWDALQKPHQDKTPETTPDTIPDAAPVVVPSPVGPSSNAAPIAAPAEEAISPLLTKSDASLQPTAAAALSPSAGEAAPPTTSIMVLAPVAGEAPKILAAPHMLQDLKPSSAAPSSDSAPSQPNTTDH